jgi:hypothetical protein
LSGYAEKVFRLVVCEKLKLAAPGIEYNASMIADLHVLDPWKTDPEFKVPAVELSLVRLGGIDSPRSTTRPHRCGSSSTLVSTPLFRLSSSSENSFPLEDVSIVPLRAEIVKRNKVRREF